MDILLAKITFFREKLTPSKVHFPQNIVCMSKNGVGVPATSSGKEVSVYVASWQQHPGAIPTSLRALATICPVPQQWYCMFLLIFSCRSRCELVGQGALVYGVVACNLMQNLPQSSNVTNLLLYSACCLSPSVGWLLSCVPRIPAVSPRW